MVGAVMTFSLKDKKLQEEARRLAKLGDDFEPFLKSIGEEFVGAGGVINTRFKEEKDPDGESWAPLSADWVAIRKKRYHGAPVTILRMRGQLAGSINYQIQNGRLSIGTGTNVAHYAGVHQFGYDGGEGKPTIAARPYLGFSDDDYEMIEEEALDHFFPDG